MKRVLSFIKKHKILSVALLIILLLVIIPMIFIMINSKGGSYGSRCNDSKKYEISSKTIKNVKKRINEISLVNDIDIYTKLCTIKIIINLKDDVDVEVVKQMSSDILTKFSDKELKHYDFALYVTSDNDKSETYPINVTKHKTKDNFAW